jgi:hypothetical protein
MKKLVFSLVAIALVASTIIVTTFCIIKSKNAKQNINVGQEFITTASQYDYVDTSDVNTAINYYENHDIEFSQKLKDIVLSDKNTKMPLFNVETELKQKTTPDKSNNYGTYKGQNFTYDSCKRNQD